MRFGALLRDLRERRGWSLRDLGEQICFNRGYIGKIEQGEKFPDRRFAELADSALDARGSLIEAWHRDADERPPTRLAGSSRFPRPSRSLDDEALARVYQATAYLQLDDLDASVSALRPVLDLPKDRQISWIKKRLGRIEDMLRGERYRGSSMARDLRQVIRDIASWPGF